jgi:hypothetical protein
MKKLMSGIVSLVLVTVFSGMAFADDPFTPSKDSKVIPATKPLLSPEKGQALQEQTEKRPGPAADLPQNVGVISGTIEVFDTPRGGCSSVRFQLEDNDLIVPASNLFLYRTSTSDPLSTGHGYKISNLRPGVHIISMKTSGECAGFQWAPVNSRIELTFPDRMKAEERNFVYKRVPAKFIKPFKPIQ